MATILRFIREAAAQGVDVVLFPETCICGYVLHREHYDAIGRAAVEEAEARVIEASRQLAISVILGTVTWEGETLFNSLLVIDKGGIVRGRYSKVFLAEPWPAGGQQLPVYEVAGVPSCFIICHDVRYPELVRLPAMAGAQVCYYSSHESGLREEYKLSAYHAMPVSRATENGIFLVMANAAANRVDLSGSHGNSKIVHPDGNVLEEAGYFDERLVIQRIAINDAHRVIARRCMDDDTPLREWFREGLDLVSRG